MTDQELNHLRRRLEEMRDDLQASLTQGDPAMVSIAPDNAIGRLNPHGSHPGAVNDGGRDDSAQIAHNPRINADAPLVGVFTLPDRQ
jgi:hypothetical protein